MDGKGRVFDNIFIERLWRSLKYEEVYPKGYQVYADAQEERMSQIGRKGGAEMRMAMTDILNKGVTYLKAPKRVIKSLLENVRHIFTHKNRQYVCPRHKIM